MYYNPNPNIIANALVAATDSPLFIIYLYIIK